MGPRPFGRGMFWLCPKTFGANVSFNGAATFRSRNAAPPCTHYDRHRWLQWGRDLSVAECQSGFAGPSFQPLLQWGRDLSVAECWLRSRQSRNSKHRLQWGRDLSVAECGSALATIQPASMPLQWGRDLSVAECKNQDAVLRWEGLASMGPRPFGRGMYGGIMLDGGEL